MSPWSRSPTPSARILSIDTQRRAGDAGRARRADRRRVCAATEPHAAGVDVPKVRWYPLARGWCAMPANGWPRWCADTRALAEDAAEQVDVDYEPLAAVIDPGDGAAPDAPLVHPDHGTNVLFQPQFVWGAGGRGFRRRASTRSSFRARWGRSATVPIETFGAVAQLGRGHGDAGRLGLDPDAQISPIRSRDALRLPGNAGARAPGRRRRRQLRRQARHEAHHPGRLSRAQAGLPVRLDRGPAGEHVAAATRTGPTGSSTCRSRSTTTARCASMKIRALDDVGAYPGRAPLQLGKPVDRHRRAVPHRQRRIRGRSRSPPTRRRRWRCAASVRSPTNFAIETRDGHGGACISAWTGIEVRRRNLIRKDEFPYMIPSGTDYDCGDYHTVLDKALAIARPIRRWSQATR